MILGGLVGEAWKGGIEPGGAATAVLPSMEREVTVESAGLRLAGTLTVPQGEGPFPAVVLLSGAGPHDRDGTIGPHRRFRVLADHLARAGIASLRMDDRGVGESEGRLVTSTLHDLAGDARAMAAFLADQAEVNPAAVGLLGGSQGSEVASLAAAGNEGVAFVVLLSPPGLPGAELLAEQQAALAGGAGAGPEARERIRVQTAAILDKALSRADTPELRAELAEDYLRLARELPEPPRLRLRSRREEAERRVDQLFSPLMRSELRYRPEEVLRILSQPVLVLAGDLDVQTDPELCFPPIRKALGEAGVEATFHRFPGLNHLLQPAETGLPDEYAALPVAFADEVLREISGWIAARFPPVSAAAPGGAP